MFLVFHIFPVSEKTTTYLRGLGTVPIIRNLLPGTGFMEHQTIMECEAARDKPDTRTSRTVLLA